MSIQNFTFMLILPWPFFRRLHDQLYENAYSDGHYRVVKHHLQALDRVGDDGTEHTTPGGHSIQHVAQQLCTTHRNIICNKLYTPYNITLPCSWYCREPTIFVKSCFWLPFKLNSILGHFLLIKYIKNPVYDTLSDYHVYDKN